MPFRKNNQPAATIPAGQSRTITICARNGCNDEGVVRPLPGSPLVCAFHDAEFEAVTGTGPGGPNDLYSPGRRN